MRPPQRIVVGTRNPGKLRELQTLLADLPLAIVDLSEFPNAPEIEEDGDTFAANATKKATVLAQVLNEWVVADDSGIEVDALDGRPGIFSARYTGPDGNDQTNNARVLSELAQVPQDKRTATFRCVIALASPGQLELLVEGESKGIILETPRGSNGFGYDPVFLYPPLGRTFAELDGEAKNRVSHRGRALAKLKVEATKLLGGC